MSEPDPQPPREAPAAAKPRRCPLVGIGASAGGLPAFKTFLAHTPPRTGIAFIVVQHLSPRHESALVSLLSPHTSMPVVEARDGVRVEPDHVYIIAPATNLSIAGGVLRVAPQAEGVLRHPIDVFLLSLAESEGENAAAVILTGAGHDGTLGLKAVKEQGGLTITQSAETADHESMLQSAVRTGLVDFQLGIEDIRGGSSSTSTTSGRSRSSVAGAAVPSPARRSCSRSVPACAPSPGTISRSTRTVPWCGASSGGCRSTS